MAKPRSKNLAELLGALGEDGLRCLILAGRQRGLKIPEIADFLSIPINAALEIVHKPTLTPQRKYPRGTVFGKSGIPIIPCDIGPTGEFEFHCPHCRATHRHGVSAQGIPEHRLSHCFRQGSPLVELGYYVAPKPKLEIH
jgi:hypothetical protein